MFNNEKAYIKFLKTSEKWLKSIGVCILIKKHIVGVQTKKHFENPSLNVKKDFNQKNFENLRTVLKISYNTVYKYFRQNSTRFVNQEQSFVTTVRIVRNYWSEILKILVK